MKNKKLFLTFAVLLMALVLVPELGFASVESSLVGIQTKLTRVILPTLSITGIFKRLLIQRESSRKLGVRTNCKIAKWYQSEIARKASSWIC
jgi:hypothetical protein